MTQGVQKTKYKWLHKNSKEYIYKGNPSHVYCNMYTEHGCFAVAVAASRMVAQSLYCCQQRAACSNYVAWVEYVEVIPHIIVEPADNIYLMVSCLQAWNVACTSFKVNPTVLSYVLSEIM
jgi:hypothetical protein